MSSSSTTSAKTMSSASSQSSSSSTLSTYTLSSWSSVSRNSSSSSSSSSSSWSSESSKWDTGSAQAKSYLVMSEITVRSNRFHATCQVDLRWRDAVIVEARGPLLADIGGTFNGETHTEHTAVQYVPAGAYSSDQYLVSFIDDYRLYEDWDSLEAAQAWVAAIESRLQAAMAVLRALYTQFPNKFDQRTRTV